MDKNKIIQNAQKFIQKGQLDKAIREYQKIVEVDPKDVRTRLKIGDLYAKRGDNREAADTYLLVAEAYSQQGFFLKAVAVYKQILKLDPNLVDVNLKLAELYQQLGLMSDAMAQYQSVANFFERSGNIRASFQTLERMLELEPDNIASRIKLAEMYSKEGMAAEAVDQFRQAAEYLKANNRVDDWIKVVERLVYHEPGEVALTRELANVYLAKGDTKRALAKLQVCFKADPRDVETLHLLARAFLELGQPSKTVSVYKELAKIYGDEGDLEQQRATWRKVLEVVPDDAEAQNALGMRPEPAAPAPPPPAGPPPGARPPAGPPPGVRPAAGPPPGARPAPAAVRPAPAAPATPAPVSGADAVGKLLTETDVYVKYGLHDKAIEHLKKIFAIDPQNLSGHEKAKDLFKQAGNNEAAGQELVTLVQLTKAQDPERARGYLGELASVAPHLPEVAGFVKELGAPQVESVSFLESPAVPAEDEIVIADDDDEVLVADGDDFGEDEAFVIADDDEFGDESVFVADDEDEGFGVEIEPPPRNGVELRDDDEGFGVEIEPSTHADMSLHALDDEEEIPLEGPFGAVEIDAGGDDTSDGEEGGAFVIDETLLDADLDAAMAEAEAASDDEVAEPDNPTETLPLEAVPELVAAREAAERAERAVEADLDGGIIVDESLYADAGTVVDGGSASPMELGFELEPDAGFELEPDAGFELDAGEEDSAEAGADLDLDEASLEDAGADLDLDEASLEDAGADLAAEAETHFDFDGQVADDGFAASLDDEAAAEDAKSPEEIADELEEAEFFIEQGLPDEAREVIASILAVVPDHEGALGLLAQLDAGDETPDEADFEDDLEGAPEASAPFDSEPDEEEEAGFDDFDLAGELAEELAGLEGEEGVAAAPLEDFQVSADDVFAEFKKGVAKTVSAEDAETHYDLGIAYREMGLVRDAISEFEISARQSKKHAESITMIGVCYRELGELDEAIRIFQSLGSEEGQKPDVLKAAYFELGDCHQQKGDVAEAGWYFRKVRKLDPKFRDVLARLELLGEADVDEDEEPPPGVPKNGTHKAAASGTSAPQEKRAGKSSKVGYL